MEHSSSSSGLEKKGKRLRVPTAILGTGLDALLYVAEIDKKEETKTKAREKRQREKQIKEIKNQEKRKLMTEKRNRLMNEERKILLKETRENDNLIAALTRLTLYLILLFI